MSPIGNLTLDWGK